MTKLLIYLILSQQCSPLVQFSLGLHRGAEQSPRLHQPLGLRLIPVLELLSQQYRPL